MPGNMRYFQKEDAFPKLRDAIEEYFGSDLRRGEGRGTPADRKTPAADSGDLDQHAFGVQAGGAEGRADGDCLADLGDRRGRDRSMAGAGAGRGGRARLAGARANAHGRASRQPTGRAICCGWWRLCRSRKKKQESTCCGASKSPIPMTSGRRSRWDDDIHRDL